MRKADCPEGLSQTLLIKASVVARHIAEDRIAAVTVTICFVDGTTHRSAGRESGHGPDEIDDLLSLEDLEA